MTDYPRFEPLSCRPDVAHRHYHGGRFVDLVLGIVDRRALPRPTGPAPRALKFEVCVPIALVLLLLGAFAGLNAAHSPRSGPIADTLPDADICAHRRGPQASSLRAAYVP